MSAVPELICSLLAQVMGPFLDALMGEMTEGEAQRDVLQLASQELRQAAA